MTVHDKLNKTNIGKIIEALIFASEKPITLNQIHSILNSPTLDETPDRIKEAFLEENKINSGPDEIPDELTYEEVINENKFLQNQNMPSQIEEITDDQIMNSINSLIEFYNEPESAINLCEIGEGFQFRTNQIYSKWIKVLNIAKPIKLTKAALETLAVLAYKQPITKTELDNVRGVDSGYTIRFLLEKKLAKILGKKDIPGKPLLYGTSNEFLSLFGLKNLSSLPTLREFKELTEKHAAKVSEFFSDPTIDELKRQGPTLSPIANNEDDIDEIDRALSDARKIKSIDKILEHELFKEDNDENSSFSEEFSNNSNNFSHDYENNEDFEPSNEFSNQIDDQSEDSHLITD